MMTEPIFVGIGANLDHAAVGTPRNVCDAAVRALQAGGLSIVSQSRWYESAPVPMSDQPWYVNGVVMVRPKTHNCQPRQVLEILHRIEDEFGRQRGAVNAARVLDLDLLAFGDQVLGWWLTGSGAPPVGAGAMFSLPHPRLHQRAFVVLPLAEIAPNWVHPALNSSVAELTAQLPAGQEIRRLPIAG